MKIYIIDSEQALAQWNSIMDSASQGETYIIIERGGKKAVVLIAYEAYQSLQPYLVQLRTPGSKTQRSQEMAHILEQLAALSERTQIEDPIKWQIELRKDRKLPGRD